MIDPACAVGQSTQIDIQRIMAMIPHRHPFLMIDRVVDVVTNQRATGRCARVLRNWRRLA